MKRERERERERERKREWGERRELGRRIENKKGRKETAGACFHRKKSKNRT